MKEIKLIDNELEFYLKDSVLKLSLDNIKEVIKQISMDELFDIIKQSDAITSREVKERVLSDYPEEFEWILHDFFNDKSNKNKYLEAEQQEDLEGDFAYFINNNF